ncbi:MAG: hypothetical protein F7B20_02230 [Aeropyrum sp.]|nr:hypothetical protein [Aeropyrum sp.]MCE4615824.1 hypothetical protein [Aeropyrum sp.]
MSESHSRLWRAVWVDFDRSRRVGQVISSLLGGFKPDPFTDPELYPPVDSSRELVTIYFLVMVAMDHRLSRPSKPYEAVVGSRLYHGADLLYRLGAAKLSSDPDFFTAERLSKLTADDVKDWLSAGASRPPDIEVRARLLRDLGEKLLRNYGGSAWSLIVESRGRLRYGVGEGFVDRLKIFTAYQDPVEKKAFLLAKFLERRGVVRFSDPENKELPIDNHLARLAVRTGIVGVSEDLLERIRRGLEFEPIDDVLLRLAARRAWKVVSQSSGLDPFVLDDFLWMFGRKCCTRDHPTCRAGCSSGCGSLGWCDGGCPLSNVCPASRDNRLMVPEHTFYNTWWY